MLNQNLFGPLCLAGTVQTHNNIHLPAKDVEEELRQSADFNKEQKWKLPYLQTNIRCSLQSSLAPLREHISLWDKLSIKMFTCNKPFNIRIKSKMLEDYSGQSFPY